MSPSDIRHPNDWNAYRQRAIAFSASRNVGAVSGVGSTRGAARPLVNFLLLWLSKHPEVTSVVEASCGHWASGWQSGVVWPQLDYSGVDIIKEQVDANAALVHAHKPSRFGLKTAEFLHADMLQDALPTGDLLFTKDTLIHFSNDQIKRFLLLSVTRCPPLFKYVLFVQDQPMRNKSFNEEIGRAGHHPLNFALLPFQLNVSTIFTYPSGRCCKKSVQLLNLTQTCGTSIHE